MNNNRNNNSNRRRGRGSNRGGGSPNQSNRIDSRSRGNAPQMLDKYKKLAQEAQLNDDRVQTEYYLQFADHYFRVIADSKTQKDDSRGNRDGNDNNSRDDARDGARDDDSDDNDRRDDRQDGRQDGRQDERSKDRSSDRGPDRSKPRRNPRPRKDSGEAQPQTGHEGEASGQGDEDNPFTREAAKPAAAKPRKPRKKADAAPANGGDKGGGLDPATLPPSIARADSGEESAAKPRKQLRTRRPRDEGGDEALEAVG